MFYLTILCVLMALLSAVFWVIEIRPAYLELKGASFNDIPVLKWFINPFIAIGCVLNKGRYFIADFVATVTLAMIFGLSGVIGTTMGLTISNVISIALLIAMSGTNHRKATT